MRAVCAIVVCLVLFQLRAEREWNPAIIAATFHTADHTRDHWPNRAADFIPDDLAYAADTAHHGSHRIVLYRAIGSLCRRNSGTADPRLDVSTLLSPGDPFRRPFSDKFSAW